MIWLISGSRDFPDEALARAVFRNQFKKGDAVYAGGARGVDTWAEEEALKKGCLVRLFGADWDAYGKSAGIRRNAEMFDRVINSKEAKRALIIWDGASHGTKHMLGLVENHGMPLTLVRAGYD